MTVVLQSVGEVDDGNRSDEQGKAKDHEHQSQ